VKLVHKLRIIGSNGGIGLLFLACGTVLLLDVGSAASVVVGVVVVGCEVIAVAIVSTDVVLAPPALSEDCGDTACGGAEAGGSDESEDKDAVMSGLISKEEG